MSEELEQPVEEPQVDAVEDEGSGEDDEPDFEAHRLPGPPSTLDTI